ncbi:hypothetical protein [Labrys miyagiensis]|uniref:hypothetical protein n=1 Tax=Labrys miyagiensis TaxID=346912 RepID=UPI0024E18D6B|nr:hypothetical protein [Labrys miyagiensis]
MAQISAGSQPTGISINRSGLSTGGGDVVGRDSVGGDNIGGDKITINAFVGAEKAYQADDNDLGSARPPRLLPYLTDRAEQLRYLTGALQRQFDRGLNKPVTFFAIGSDDDCLDSFVEQILYLRLPSILNVNGLPPAILFRSLQWPSANVLSDQSLQSTVNQLDGMKDQIHDMLGLRSGASTSMVEQKLANIRASCFFHVALQACDWSASQATLVEAWLHWLNELHPSKVPFPIITVVSIGYPSDFFGRLRWQRALSILRRDINSLTISTEFALSAYVLPRLRSVRFDDVELWIREYVDNADREVLRRHVRRYFLRRRLFSMFGIGDRTLPMYQTAEAVKLALRDKSVRLVAP